MVKEDPEADEGIAYVIDSWRITATIHYDEYGVGARDATDALFDFDTYKILAGHLLKKNVRASLIPYDSQAIASCADEAVIIS